MYNIDFFKTATIRSLRTKMQLLHPIYWRGNFSDESPENLQKLHLRKISSPGRKSGGKAHFLSGG